MHAYNNEIIQAWFCVALKVEYPKYYKYLDCYMVWNFFIKFIVDIVIKHKFILHVVFASNIK